MSSSIAEALARGAVRDDDSFMGALARGYGLAGILDDMNARAHEREVNGRMDQILAASNGGQTDLSTLDPKLYSDRVGMEAMGKVSQQLSQTGEYQNKIFSNSIQQAKNLFGIAQGYMTDFNAAVKAGDSQRALNIFGNMANRMNLPYRFVPEGEGFRLYHVTPDGEIDMGTMSLTDAYKKTADVLNNEQAFIKGSAAYSMTNWETNQKNFSDPSKWRYAVSKDGKQIALVPQLIERNGQMVPGFYAERLGNRTAQDLLDAGFTIGNGAGLTAAQAARATRGGGGRRGLGGSRSQAGQPEITDDGIKIDAKTMKGLTKLADENSKVKGGAKDMEHSTWLVEQYKKALGVSRAAKGGKISERDFIAFMQNQRKIFEKENAGELEGMSPAEINEAFRGWYEDRFEAGQEMLQSGGLRQPQSGDQTPAPEQTAPAQQVAEDAYGGMGNPSDWSTPPQGLSGRQQPAPKNPAPSTKPTPAAKPATVKGNKKQNAAPASRRERGENLLKTLQGK